MITLAKADPDELRVSLLTAARRLATDPDTDANFETNRRTLAAAFLAFDSSDQATSILEAIVIDENARPALRYTAFDSLAFRPGTPSFITENWEALSSRLKTVTIAILTSRRDGAQTLLEAVASGKVSRESITLNQATLLREHQDKQVAALAATLFPPPEIADRAKVVKQYAKALILKGDPTRGKEVYKTGACITCHKSPSGEGFAVGPDLATFKTAGSDSILTNLFNPNAEVASQYQAFTFTLENGESLIGIIAAEDPQNVTIRMAGGQERTFPRRQVQTMKGLGQSLMPEGLEASLTEQDVADLLEFINTLR
jgi:putative heme-binding domain-containing protein